MATQNPTTAAPIRTSRPRSERIRKAMFKFIRTKPLGALGLALVVAACLIAVIGPQIAPYDPRFISVADRLQGPSANHIFGTDNLGRDMLSRTIYGARISMMVGITVMLLAGSIAAFIGITSAFNGGVYDLVVQRFIDAKSAFPALLLALALMATFGTSLSTLIVSLVIIFSSTGVRVIRSQVLSIKEMPYVDAARALGAGKARIMMLHVVPNTFGTMMVYATSMIGAAILLEASLSFLGVGTPASVITWGSMLSGETLLYFTAQPSMILFPGFALTLVVYGINIFGDSLRDVMDPRMRGSR